MAEPTQRMTKFEDGSFSILWRRLDRPGHEAALLLCRESSWRLQGAAVFLHGGKSCCLHYRIVCDSDWRTRFVEVSGWTREDQVLVRAEVGASGGWEINGAKAPEIDGCVDIDLNFSPSTNLLPIRRLGLRIGEEKEVLAAWLRFPSFNIEPLQQRYFRLSENFYRYQSGNGRFETQLEVNQHGFVTLYPSFWQLDERG